MRKPNQQTSSFFHQNEKLLERKSELITLFPKLNTNNYHLGIFREELIKTLIIDSLKSESLQEVENIKIESGFIKDDYGNISKQIDILIFPKTVNYYQYGMFYVVNVNDVIAAIEIKSKLNLNTLSGKNGALSNICRIRDIEANTNHHVFAAIIGYESIQDKLRLKDYIKQYYRTVFRKKREQFISQLDGIEIRDLATKKITPDLIVSLDNLILRFGIKLDGQTLNMRPVLFHSSPNIEKYSSVQYLYFELLSYILNYAKTDIAVATEKLSDNLNFNKKEKSQGYTSENILGNDWESSHFLD
jgi:hypothetical protein